MVFGQIDKLGISIIQTDQGFLNDLGLTGADKNAKIGMITFIFTISYALSNIFWGFIIDKLGARKTGIIGLVVWAMTMVIGGLSTSYEMFILSRVILGIGEGMMIPICGKFISNWFNQRELGRAQSLAGRKLFRSCMRSDYLNSCDCYIFHWQTASFVLAAFNILIVLPMFIFLTRDTPEEHPRLDKNELAYIRQSESKDQLKSNTLLKITVTGLFGSAC